MPIVTLRDILTPCLGQPWAVPAFDTCNLETTIGLLRAAEAERSPIIVMIVPRLVPTGHWPHLLSMIRLEAERTGLPVCAHLDHGTSLEEIALALDLGFSSVMIDGSTLPFDENVALTSRCVALARPLGVTVEAELGHVGSGLEVLSAEDGEASLTSPLEARDFVRETGVDALAVSIGTLHGLYRRRPQLAFDRLAEIREAVAVPLVLHGGSDTPESDLVQAIAIGIDKVNVWTDIRIPYMRAVRDILDSRATETTDLSVVVAAAQDAVVGAARGKMRLFGSSGRAAQLIS